MKISEEFLYFIWQFQYFHKNGLKTSQGENILVLHPGFRNSNAGPDFLEARIKINQIEWVGFVEIHIKSSDWFLHDHNIDPNFDNVVLHVVWEDDIKVKRNDGSLVPAISICNRVNKAVIDKYQSLTMKNSSIVCLNQWAQMNPLIVYSQFDRCLIERLKRKSAIILDLLSKTNNDWEEAAFITLAEHFGFKVNNEPFIRLGKSLPLKILLRYGDRLNHIEALIFGYAGFLSDDQGDMYYNMLRNEFLFIKKKYSLPPSSLKRHHWKFLRLRPSNFPTIRLAQFAALIFNVRNLYSYFTTEKNYTDMIKKLSVHQSEYWINHYDFGKESAREMPFLGASSIQNLIINVVVPILFTTGEYYKNEQWKERSLMLLNKIRFEDNVITRLWKGLELMHKTAYESQSMIELYHEYCLKKKCLSCNIGTALLKPTKH